MAMHVAGVPDRKLVAIGQWLSLGFMVYIQQYILSFSVRVLVHMIQKPQFWNLLAPCRPASPPKHPTHTLTDPGPVWWTEQHPFPNRPTKTTYDRPSTSPSQFSAKTPTKPPSRGPIEISNQKSFQIAQPGSIWNFRPKVLPNHPSGVHSKYLWKTPSGDPSSHRIIHLRKKSSKYPSNTPFRKPYPQNPL